MLIIPSLVEESCDHDLIVTNFCKSSPPKFVIVALVPSTKNCRQYQNLGAITATTGNIVEELDKLKKGIFQKSL